MTADEYLHVILRREVVDTGISSPVRGVQGVLTPIIQQWAGTQLVAVSPSGSFAKGTANSSGTDIDHSSRYAKTPPRHSGRSTLACSRA
jgi:hypothetical protein